MPAPARAHRRLPGATPAIRRGCDEARAQTWEHIGQGARNTADYLERKLTELSAKTASDTEIGEQ